MTMAQCWGCSKHSCGRTSWRQAPGGPLTVRMTCGAKNANCSEKVEKADKDRCPNDDGDCHLATPNARVERPTAARSSAWPAQYGGRAGRAPARIASRAARTRC